MEVYAGPCPRSCLSVLTALLFSFLSPAHHAQEISLLLVSRVSLLCDLLLSGGVALESSLLPLFCLERPFFVGFTSGCFLQFHPWEKPGGLCPYVSL